MRKACLAGAGQGFRIHEGNHQHLLAVRIDSDGGEEAFVVKSGKEGRSRLAIIGIRRRQGGRSGQ